MRSRTCSAPSKPALARRFSWLRHALPPIAALLLGTGFSASAGAEAANFTLDPAHTFPSFSVSHAGFSLHHGRFNRSEGKLVLHFAKRQGSVEISIAADSIDTGDAELEKQLRGSNFFSVAEFPTLHFKSTEIVFAGDTPQEVHGTLTLLGVSRPVTLYVERFHCGVHPLLRTYVCGANARASIRRSDFGMGKFLSLVGDEVEIRLQVEAVRESAADTIERAGRAGR